MMRFLSLCSLTILFSQDFYFETVAFRPKPYQITLDNKHNIFLSWELDYKKEIVTFQIKAEIPRQRWFAFGMSDYGDLEEADMCILWVDLGRRVRFQDIWTDDMRMVHMDKEQDCNLIDFEEDGPKFTLTFQRKFDTCDEYDYVIEDGTTHLIFAFGNEIFWSLGELNISSGYSGMQRVQLLKNNNSFSKLPRDVKIFEVKTKKVRVPDLETTYWCYIRRLPLLYKKHHIVQFEAVIQPGNEALVHHMEVFHCEVKPGEKVARYNGPCQAEIRPKQLEVCRRVIGAWAMGALPLTYPDEAGFPIGGPEFSPYVMIEIHYNNVDKRSDWIDSSGLRFHYTPHLRRYDAGCMELGLEYSPKMAIPPQISRFSLTGHCIPECTEIGLPQQGIKIFASQLHTHLTGKRVWTKHVRNGVELPELNRDNHYSSHFQEIRRLQHPVHVLPGDALVTTCEYDTSRRDNLTLGGYAITEEMCVNYVHYYPKTRLEVCKSSIDTNALYEYFDLMHDLEGADTFMDKSVEDNYRAIQWTPDNSRFLHRLYENTPLSMQCNQSNGNRFRGYWNNMPQVEIIEPLVKRPRKCPKY